MTFHGFRAMARPTLDVARDLRPDYNEHQLDAGDGGTAGGGQFAFGTALESVGHRRVGGC